MMRQLQTILLQSATILLPLRPVPEKILTMSQSRGRMMDTFSGARSCQRGYTTRPQWCTRMPLPQVHHTHKTFMHIHRSVPQSFLTNHCSTPFFLGGGGGFQRKSHPLPPHTGTKPCVCRPRTPFFPDPRALPRPLLSDTGGGGGVKLAPRDFG